MKSKSPSWRGKATVCPRRQGRRGVAFIGAKRKPLTEGADRSGAAFSQEGQCLLKEKTVDLRWNTRSDSRVRECFQHLRSGLPDVAEAFGQDL